MGKTIIQVACTDQRLTAISSPLVASGGRGEDMVEFDFCPLWDGFEKTAVFYRFPEVAYHAVIVDNKCVIPHEVLRDEGAMYFGVFGAKDDIVRTSEVLRYNISKGAITKGTTPSDPTPDIYAQILAKLAAIENGGGGMTAEQAEQLEQNTADIAQLSEEKVDKALFDEVFEIHEASPNLYVPQSEGWTDNALITSGGYPTVNDTSYKYYCVTPEIKLEAGTYTITPPPTPNTVADKNTMRLYDSNGVVLAQQPFTRTENGITFTVPGSAATVRFTVLKDNFLPGSLSMYAVLTAFNNCVMIVKGTEAPSEYVPYYPAGNTMKNIAIPDGSVTLETIGDDAKPVIAPLMGKKIANFGDSIFGNARPPMDVSTFLADNTGATVYNCAFGGCRMAEHVGHWDAFSMYRLAYAIANNDYTVQDDAIGYDDRTSYAEEPLAVMKAVDYSGLDILTIGYGTNDFTGNNQIDNADNPLDTSTVCGALRYSIETLLTAYPNLRIFVLLPTYRFWIDSANAYTDDAFNHANDLGKTLIEYIDAIAETAKDYNVPVIDNFAELGINKFNRQQYFPVTDGTHHNENGRKLIAKHLAHNLW